jgi:hypothetical protein
MIALVRSYNAIRYSNKTSSALSPPNRCANENGSDFTRQFAESIKNWDIFWCSFLVIFALHFISCWRTSTRLIDLNLTVLIFSSFAGSAGAELAADAGPARMFQQNVLH